MFGFYRICRLVGDAYVCESEGVVYADAITKEELHEIGIFVSGTLGDVEVKQFPPETGLHVHLSFPDFMQKVFWPAVRKGWMIVGFNLAFDLSRLATQLAPVTQRRIPADPVAAARLQESRLEAAPLPT